ncbi:MAG TPA: hypothetical protein VLS47_08575 [Gallionella sp.]|nr:hypothetical protein [Gallionella sp.]
MSGVTSTSTMPPTSPASTPRLDRGAGGDALHRVDAHLGLAPEQFLEIAAHHRHARRAADEHHAVHILRGDARIAQGLLDRTFAAVDHRAHQAFQFGAVEVQFEMARLAVDSGEIGQADVRGDAGSQFDLGVLGRFDQACGGLAVAAHIDAGGHLEALGEVLVDALVHVGAAELGIPAGGLDFEHALAEFHDRHVQRAAAEVDHDDAQFLRQPVKTVGQRSGGGLVDQAHHFQAGDAAGILGRGALVVVEIGRHGYHRLLHRLAEKGFGIALDLLQQESGQLFRGIILVPQADVFAPPHPALESAGGALGIRCRLAPRGFADQHLPVCGERDITGECLAADADAFGAGDDDGASSAQHCGGGIGSAQIDTDDGHDYFPLFRLAVLSGRVNIMSN